MFRRFPTDLARPVRGQVHSDLQKKGGMSLMETEIEKKDVQLEDIECQEAPCILEEITMEEMAVDGICGIY